MQLTHNSLATIIGWVSTCLLAGGASAMFNDSSRIMWMNWGCFGITAAIGLDVTARVRERRRSDELKLTANKRYDRDMKYAKDDMEASAAVREAVARMLGHTSAPTSFRRTEKRYLCDLAVELHLCQGLRGAAGYDDANTRLARITNLSESGFELLLTEALPQRRMEMIITGANGDRQTMFGEVLWESPPDSKPIVAGGRFLDAASIDGN